MARRKPTQFDSERALTWVFLVMMAASLLAGLIGAAVHAS